MTRVFRCCLSRVPSSLHFSLCPCATGPLRQFLVMQQRPDCLPLKVSRKLFRVARVLFLINSLKLCGPGVLPVVFFSRVDSMVA